MRCLSPRTVGFLHDGVTISWSPKYYSKEYATFQLPCSKCIECRLEYARQWAVRCVHEAKMHPENSFITLTYSDEHLTSEKLQYIDFQLFAKRLRKKIHKEAKKQDYDPEKKKSQFSSQENTVKRKKGPIGTLLSSIGDQLTWSTNTLTKEEIEYLILKRFKIFGTKDKPNSAQSPSNQPATSPDTPLKNSSTETTTITSTNQFLKNPAKTPSGKNS